MYKYHRYRTYCRDEGETIYYLPGRPLTELHFYVKNVLEIPQRNVKTELAFMTSSKQLHARQCEIQTLHPLKHIDRHPTPHIVFKLKMNGLYIPRVS